MNSKKYNKIFKVGFLAFFLSFSTLNAQLDKIFIDLFEGILGENGALTSEAVKDPDSGDIIFEQFELNDAFRLGAEEIGFVLPPNLNRLIANNVSSFPLSSTSAGINYVFKPGTSEPIRTADSYGPIFAETGRTLGKGKVNFGMNYNFLNLNKIRGIKTKDIRFTFVHRDVGKPGLGDSEIEGDLVDVFLDMNTAANIFAFYTTVGITDNLDIGVALPIINLTISGEAEASVQSNTFLIFGQAAYHFGGESGGFDDPFLTFYQPYSASAFGIGDLALRLKYALPNDSGVDVAALIDARLPTGNKHNFMSTGKTNIRLIGIVSKKFGDFTPHLNAGYDYRRGYSDSNEAEFAIGFDQKLVKGLTFALDFLGEIDLIKKDALIFDYYSGQIVISDLIRQEDDSGNAIIGTRVRIIEQTNIPSRDNDNVLSTAVGFRYAPSPKFVLLGNVLLPLNDGGLRSDVAYTFGFSITP